MEKKKLSPGQKRVYDKLVTYLKRYGASPDLSAFAKELGMGYMSLKQHLVALNNKEYLSFESRGRGKSPVLNLPAAVTGIPILGYIVGGAVESQEEHVEGYLRLPDAANSYGLRVHGNSMADLIQDGDVVLIKPAKKPEYSGQICAARLGDSETTLKYVERISPDLWRLRAHNKDQDIYPPRDVKPADLHIDGVYQGLVRGTILGALYEES
ncbi:MAG: S24 family peptidase [Deinococcota bacterium]